MHEAILHAAVRALTHIAITNGGQLPETLTEVHALPAAYGIAMEPWRHGYKLAVGPDGPVIFYNPSDLPTTQKRGILHEIVEWLAYGDDMSLLEEIDGLVMHQNGGSRPADPHHETAAFAERVYVEWLRRRS